MITAFRFPAPISGTKFVPVEEFIAKLQADNLRLQMALNEIVTICTEDRSACRKRMGTRVGNCLVTAQDALKS